MLYDLGSEIEKLHVEKSIVSKKYAFSKCDNKCSVFSHPHERNPHVLVILINAGNLTIKEITAISPGFKETGCNKSLM